MHKIDTASTVNAMPTPSAVGSPGWFARGNPSAGVPFTVVSSDWANAVQAEILNVMAAASLSPDKTSQTQLLAAINSLIGTHAIPEVATELLLPSAGTAPFAAYFVHAHTPYNSRPALALRLASNWYFLDASLITNATGTSITSDDRWSPLHRFFGGHVCVGPDPNSSNQNIIQFVNSGGTPLGWMYFGSDNKIHISANTSSATPVDIDSAGNIVAAGGFASSSGNIVANTGRCRALLGAFGSGDGNANTILNDFDYTVGGSLVTHHRFPDGVITQTFLAAANWGLGVQNNVINLPVAFPTAFDSVVICYAAGSTFPTIGAGAPPDPSNPGSIGATTWGASQVLITTNYANGNLNVAVGQLGDIVSAIGH